MGSRTLLSVAALALVVASACGDEDENESRVSSGGVGSTGGATPSGGGPSIAGAVNGGLLPAGGGAGSWAGAGGALAPGGSAAAGAGDAGRAGGASGANNGGVAGWGGSAAGTSDAGAMSAGGSEGGRDVGTGGRLGPGDDLNLGGMDGAGGTYCWWPGVTEPQLAELTYAYELPEDVAACAQETCDSSECGHDGEGALCSNCTRGHDACRCACLQLYRECGDCEIFDQCIGYCLVHHC